MTVRLSEFFSLQSLGESTPVSPCEKTRPGLCAIRPKSTTRRSRPTCPELASKGRGKPRAPDLRTAQENRLDTNPTTSWPPAPTSLCDAYRILRKTGRQSDNNTRQKSALPPASVCPEINCTTPDSVDLHNLYAFGDETRDPWAILPTNEREGTVAGANLCKFYTMSRLANTRASQTSPSLHDAITIPPGPS